MPITQAVGAYSVGRDCAVVILHPLAPGGRLDLPNITGFSAKQNTTALKADRLDGRQLNAELPKGWRVSFMVDRANAAVDATFAAIEAQWYTTGSIPVGSVYQYITEPDGSTTTWKYTQAALKFEDAGDWRGDTIVKQTISAECSTREAV